MIEALPPAETRSLADNVVERLRRAILAGHFAPRERLREEQHAAALAVSRGPIREAFGQLGREGLVQRRRHRGVVVSRLSERDLAEVYSLLVALEAVALRWAARRSSCSSFHATTWQARSFASSWCPPIPKWSN